MSNNSICPICRRVIKNRIKILFDFKNQEEASTKLNERLSLYGSNLAFQEMINENTNLKRENRKLQEEKEELEGRFNDMNEQVLHFAKQFGEVNVAMKEYKNKIISLSFRLEETEGENIKYKQLLEEKEKKIAELEREKTDLHSKLEVSGGVLELLTKMEDDSDKDRNFRETVLEFVNKSDGARSLTTFVYMLHQRIRNYEKEIEELKKVRSLKRESLVERMDEKGLLALIGGGKANNTGNVNINSGGNVNLNFNKKRKYGEFVNSTANNSNLNNRLKESIHVQNSSINISENPFNNNPTNKSQVQTINQPVLNKATINPFIPNNININISTNMNKNKPQTLMPGIIMKNSFLKK